mgnify:CR=1 FL=1
MTETSSKGPGKSGQSNTDWYVLAGIVLVYGLVFVLDPTGAMESLASSWAIAITIAPILVLVTVFVAASHYAVSPDLIATYLGSDSGAIGYLVAIGGGVLSHGPVYAWYTLLADLRERGMRDGLIAVFLYNRAIKIPLLPLFLYYFRLEYAVVLLGSMILASIVQGIAVDRFLSRST